MHIFLPLFVGEYQFCITFASIQQQTNIYKMERTEIIKAIKAEVYNRKKNDKHSIAYLIGIMDYKSFIPLAYEVYKRSELLEVFDAMIETNLQKLSTLTPYKHLFN